VFLFVALYYRKDCARTGGERKIVCKMLNPWGNDDREACATIPPVPPERPLFERNVQPAVNETSKREYWVSGIGYWEENRKGRGKGTEENPF
jgi:hypothetical protein